MTPVPRKPAPRPASAPKRHGPPLELVEVEGPTIQQAIQQALVQLRAHRNDVRVKVLAEGEPGLFGMRGHKPAKVRVSRKTPPATKS